ncbi:hypothetical protein ACQP2Y_21010 [Actinoplanes sp. CA-051413]|uniref:hypothetical protein n=1 Tax=Actinoplanes sp. CA-051413 TaxID=3239899 RepID=UPI003D96030F
MKSDNELRRIERNRVATFEQGLEAFGTLHNLVEREKGRRWCGHHLLGKRPNHGSDCHQSAGTRWWDHTHGFGRGRQPSVILGWPYASHETLVPLVQAYAEHLDLQWQVGTADGPLSFYFHGATTPWLIARRDVDVSTAFTATNER